VLLAPVTVLSQLAAPGHAGLDCVAVPSFLAATTRYKKHNLMTNLRTNIFILIIMSRIALLATNITGKQIQKISPEHEAYHSPSSSTNDGNGGTAAWNFFICHNDMLLKHVDNFMFMLHSSQNHTTKSIKSCTKCCILRNGT
jgi:hypothetical protein